ncbi:hypothetical protein BSL78_27261 [Apostichopus japonicus]|uniref:Uncharacterized protein n=1 Tax=Stichopus japonicus TaxID=307972 RepID=A0A2G8JJL2_STIJA|nr:hypothetical protein BSL78_27261 [Apostichopus japonicus]
MKNIQEKKNICSGVFQEKTVTTEKLLESGNCDLLGCLLEVGTNDEEEYQKYVKMLQLKELIFKHFTDEYYQEAIQHLFKSCGETDTVIQSLEIHGGCPIVKLSNLPKILDRLVFQGVHLAENDISVVHENGITKDEKLRIYDSKVPEKLSEDELQDIGISKCYVLMEALLYERLCKDGEWKEIITANSEVQN